MRKLGWGCWAVGDMGKAARGESASPGPPGATGRRGRRRWRPRRKVADELEIEHSYTSLEAMLERKDIHAVVIAAPDKFHADAVQAAARAGKDILCEKPLGLTARAREEALRAVANAGVRLQVGFMRHYDPAYVAASKRIQAGEIGEPWSSNPLAATKTCLR